MNLFDANELAASAAEPVALPELSFEEKVDAAVNAVKQTLLAGKHLVVAWSGGKDSSCTLNIALTAVRELAAEGFKCPRLHIMHSDTKVESPVVHAYNQHQIECIRAYGERTGIDLKVWVASPSLSNDYLVGMVGGRLIASVGANTKCQQLMKANPLERVKKAIAREISAELGRKLAGNELVSLIGTRFDESAQRARMMNSRGESANAPVNLAAETGGHDWVLSPIAQMTTMDVFTYIGMVRSEKIECYDPFNQLVEVYRDMNGGDCMVNVYLAGRESERPACGSRTGCWTCTRVSRDSSAENMIAKEGGEYAWLKPLNDLRNYIRARHFDPSARCWLSRTVNEETGEIKIAPNSYSPDFTRELLGILLTIQLDEIDEAARLCIKPRFQVLNLQQLIAIDCLWQRYGYQKPFTAMRMFLEVFEQGVRYEIPDISGLPVFTEADIRFPETSLPFADEFYQDLFSGLRSIEAAAADAESLTLTRTGQYVTDCNTGSEFDIDEEAADLFVGFDLDYALNRVSLDQSPTAGIHYLMQLGTLQIFKGSHMEWDRMLRMSNQIYRHGLQPILHDPAALVAKLGGTQRGQMSLF